MDRRLLLDNELREVLQETLGYVNLYFNPPSSVRMQYDCIRYKKNTTNVRHANNGGYLIRDQYEIIAISRDPDSELPRAILEKFQYCTPGRFYVADNLYHYPFTIHY